MQRHDRWELNAVALGVLCLVVSSICDNIRGPILPLLAVRYGLNYSLTAAFLMAGSAASFFFNFFSVRLLRRVSEKGYLLCALALQSSSMLGLALGGGYPVMLACGMLWGAGNSGLGLASNLFVIRGSPRSFLGRSLSGLHAFYGLCSGIPALYVASALHRGLGLRAILLIPLALPAILALRAFSIAPSEPEGPADRGGASSYLAWDTFSVSLCIALYVMGEALTSMWLVSYLHGPGGLSLEAASRTLGGFFLALGLGRAAYFLLAPAVLPRNLPPLCLVLGALCLGLGLRGWDAAFMLAGLAFAPFFPLMVATLAVDYPERYRGLLSFVYALMTVGLAAGHLLIGRLADILSLRAAYRFPLACLLMSLAFYFLRGRTQALAYDPDPVPAA